MVHAKRGVATWVEDERDHLAVVDLFFQVDVVLLEARADDNLDSLWLEAGEVDSDEVHDILAEVLYLDFCVHICSVVSDGHVVFQEFEWHIWELHSSVHVVGDHFQSGSVLLLQDQYLRHVGRHHVDLLDQGVVARHIGDDGDHAVEWYVVNYGASVVVRAVVVS